MKARRVCPYDGLDCETGDALAEHVARVHGVEADQLDQLGPDAARVESLLRGAGMTVTARTDPMTRDELDRALVEVRAMRPGGYL